MFGSPFGSPETAGRQGGSALVGPPGPLVRTLCAFVGKMARKGEIVRERHRKQGGRSMGAAFGPSRAIAVVLAAARAIVGISLGGSPAASGGAVPLERQGARDSGPWRRLRQSRAVLIAAGRDFASALG